MERMAKGALGGQRGVDDLPFFLPSFIIRKVCENTVEGCADEESHSGSPVHLEWHFDPPESCTELEQDQDHVDKA